jgi:hypothetical protein
VTKSVVFIYQTQLAEGTMQLFGSATCRSLIEIKTSLNALPSRCDVITFQLSGYSMAINSDIKPLFE